MSNRKIALLSGPAILLLFLAGCATNRGISAQEDLELYASLAKYTPRLHGIATMSGAQLAWSESYRLMSLVSMMEATQEERFLQSAMEQIDTVLAMRDDRGGIIDEIRNRVVPAWSSIKYTKGKRYAWIVHAGMITYPMVRWSYLVLQNSAWKALYVEKALEYIAAAEETVDAFEPSWREGRTENEGFYHGDYIGKMLPLNQQNTLGRTIATLWLCTGDPRYKERAEKLAQFYKARLKEREDRYTWYYWPNRPPAEDISHAAINVDFAFVCYRAEIVFMKDDMKKFARTLLSCSLGNGDFSKRVDGTGDTSYSEAAGRWGHLLFVEPDLRPYIRRALEEHGLVRNTTSALGAAYLVETAGRLHTDRVLHEN